MSLPAFSSTELAAIAAALADSMVDTCTIDAYTEEAGEYNEPKAAYVPGPPTRCRYHETAGFSRPGSAYDLAGIDAVVYLPPGTPVKARDHITITARFGVPLSAPCTYRVLGDPSAGIASIECRLQEEHL
jgi:hypothetical protein